MLVVQIFFITVLEGVATVTVYQFQSPCPSAPPSCSQVMSSNMGVVSVQGNSCSTATTTDLLPPHTPGRHQENGR